MKYILVAIAVAWVLVQFPGARQYAEQKLAQYTPDRIEQDAKDFSAGFAEGFRETMEKKIAEQRKNAQ